MIKTIITEKYHAQDDIPLLTQEEKDSIKTDLELSFGGYKKVYFNGPFLHQPKERQNKLYQIALKHANQIKNFQLHTRDDHENNLDRRKERLERIIDNFYLEHQQIIYKARDIQKGKLMYSGVSCEIADKKIDYRNFGHIRVSDNVKNEILNNHITSTLIPMEIEICPNNTTKENLTNARDEDFERFVRLRDEEFKRCLQLRDEENRKEQARLLAEARKEQMKYSTKSYSEYLEQSRQQYNGPNNTQFIDDSDQEEVMIEGEDL